MHFIFKGEQFTYGDFTKGKPYQRVQNFERDGTKKGFYIDDSGHFRLLPDDYFTPCQESGIKFKTPSNPHLPRAERIELAKRWGITEQTINNWQRPGEHSQPYRLHDALRGITALAVEPNRTVLKQGELSEIAQSHGFYISELSVRWGWHYGGETLTSITGDENRVPLFWDLLNGMNK